MQKILNLPNIFFILILILQIVPSKRAVDDHFYFLALIIIIQIFFLLNFFFKKDREKIQVVTDIISIVFFIVFIWELLTSKLNVLNEFLFPTPGEIFMLFLSEWPELFKGFISSMELLAAGYILALGVGIPLALFIGWNKRLYRAVSPLTKVLGPIPPIVYIPYAIALLPTFKASSIFVIFIGAFWPTFINTINGVFNVDHKVIASAKTLNVNEKTMLFQVILPASLPSIISGATIGLILSFILLTAAEMIGATSGLGWYVKYFSDFGDYKRVIVGIVFIGIVVTVITSLLGKLEQYLLRWKK